MACTNSTTFYWPGTSFASASQLYTDSNLTTVAPDGMYQQGGVFREMIGGVLGAVTTCPDCIVPCDTELDGGGGAGLYLASVDIGTTVGVVLIRFQAYSVPDKCTWSYDYDNSGTPTTASEYSTQNFGYAQGVVGAGGALGCDACQTSSLLPADPGCDPVAPVVQNICNANGSNGLTYPAQILNYNFALTQFVPTGAVTTLGPYTDQASGGTTLFNTAPGWAMMVVPKPNGLPATLDLAIEGACCNTGWRIYVSCPTQLNIFTCLPSPAACTSATTDPFFTAHTGNTSGSAGSVFLHDWAFEDQYGVTIKAAGIYLVTTGAGQQCVTVGPNGVVTNVAACVGSC